MNPDRFQSITSRYAGLRLAVLGDFCLDRYLEIDPARSEVSIETGLPVHNVVSVRAQPGAAGTILNNLVALGVGTMYPIGFCGDDGEGFELSRALGSMRGVVMDHFLRTDRRRTFTYCKPLLLAPGRAPVELNRLDTKNWSPTPAVVVEQLQASASRLADRLDGLILLDQVELAGSGVISEAVLAAVGEIAREQPRLFVIADSRRGLAGFPPVWYKMNRVELARLMGRAEAGDVGAVGEQAAGLARRNGRPVVVTLAEGGMLGAGADGEIEWVAALPVRGPIDVVGAGDAVTANLTAAFAAGASMREGLEIASAAASVVVHQLGTTGTATVGEIGDWMEGDRVVTDVDSERRKA
jgi:rfaE bifunctional protein kinase chain/domain